ncbi:MULTISPECIES: amidase family protein [unclassified Thalassospira]|uniref:amidase family protein n=1 Tax=unclassified Thalassospira TaxID=2648997 RepID=UPI0007A5C9A4|nr:MULTISPECIES: amidase family protein [unclassified Thalassospira]KZD02029.1 amidase [Thalassospira sp. MCCC 1A02898]ONH86244.1 amidase [Thalassospira sp. MCCC 1A02803]
MTSDPNSLSARELARRIKSREMRATTVIRQMLDRVARVNPAINAIVQDCADDAMQEAELLDARIEAGDAVGPLAGVPVTIKVISDQAGHATTNGTTLAADLIATEDSPFLRNMRSKGAIVIGRTNTPAFSYRWFTSNKVHGTTLNPHNPALTPGGSSGGAGAATSAGLGHIGHGTDIAGSVRYPAYACGIQGLRPTHGRIPMFNRTGGDRPIGAQLMAVSGPLARRVDDLRLGLEGMAGYSPDDPWSVPMPLRGPDFAKRVALVTHPGGIDIDPRILADLERAAEIFRAAGWTVETPEIPEIREAVDLQIDLWLSDDHEAKLKAARAEDDPGAIALLEHYADRAAAIDKDTFSKLFLRRSALIRDWRAFLEDYPVVLMPVSAELPFRKDEDLEGPATLTRLWNAQLPQIAIPLLGLPAISICSGVENNMPSGVQLVAAPWREDICLTAGEVLEQGFGLPQMTM